MDLITFLIFSVPSTSQLIAQIQRKIKYTRMSGNEKGSRNFNAAHSLLEGLHPLLRTLVNDGFLPFELAVLFLRPLDSILILSFSNSGHPSELKIFRHHVNEGK
ncbi:uncharacterized protein ZBAI_06235 [Zygosaccharomyces bailii ISA1307]|nr:uncharacterized protein ZBAI_06235 [Zygosaccharomyces bailii ISA1307]